MWLASTLIENLLPKTEVDIDFHNSTEKDEPVMVELPNGDYVHIKEVFFIAGATIIRLENNDD